MKLSMVSNNLSRCVCRSSKFAFETLSSLVDTVSTSKSSFSVFSNSSFSFEIRLSFRPASKEMLRSRSKSDSIVLIDFSSLTCKDFTLSSSSSRLVISKFSFCNFAALSIFLSLNGESFLFSSSKSVLLWLKSIFIALISSSNSLSFSKIFFLSFSIS